jgi:hypothetical protein
LKDGPAEAARSIREGGRRLDEDRIQTPSTSAPAGSDGQSVLQPSTFTLQPRGLAGELPEFTLLELADRLLNRGVVLVGEATISVAGVDLIYLGLNVVLTAVENRRKPPPERR